MPKYSIESIRKDIERMGRLTSIRLQESLRAFEQLDLAEANRIIEADDVFDVLNLSIEEMSHYLMFRELGEEEGKFLRSALKVGANLEHIGDAACHIAKRVNIADYTQMTFVPFDLGEMESIALASVRESVEAYLKKDMCLVEKACLREPEQDAVYRSRLTKLQQRMKKEPENISFLLLWYSVMKYLEKVCDYTLNIGEQAIFLATGRRLKFAQYQQLDRLLAKEPDDQYRFHPYYDGISGAMVARMESSRKVLVYKEGSKRKISAEAAKLKEWQDLLPHMTPHIIDTESEGDRETLLREFVSGTLLSDLYLSSGDYSKKEEATRILFQLLIKVWTLTEKAERPVIDYTRQIRSRLAEVYAMHPYLEYLAQQNGFEELLVDAEKIEHTLAPYFSVWLHGDFNMNNIFYQEGQIQFIDVHRSHYGDYLNDVGVFLVSTLRKPNVPDGISNDMANVREIINQMVADYGQDRKDANYSARLNLSLARSYITSSRIIVDKGQARNLFENGCSLLSTVVNA